MEDPKPKPRDHWGGAHTLYPKSEGAPVPIKILKKRRRKKGLQNDSYWDLPKEKG